ncbi:MAG: zinc ribbon domain-containing protein [Verrucomicrobiota bacterium]|nr:zinc ribbon domain-containing protein [Verrucomicrobiota bacterium]MEE2615022.1 FmdB family zinc ribbon protein [Verrucomicrobiota bacterium]
MPIYEYTCEKCLKTSEHLIRSISESRTPECPCCGSLRMKKALSVFAASSSQPEPVPPSCSGNPSNCGRCS